MKGRGRFGTTRWSLVLAASGDASRDADEALTKLCEGYWYPLYGYLRGRGHAAEDAQDLTQAFFAYLLEKRVLRHADPARGRFRSFLLASLKNFVANERDRQRAKKRGGGAPILPLELETAEGQYQLEPATSDSPDKIFDRRWAAALLDHVMTRLRHEAQRVGQQEQLKHLQVYLTGDQPQHSYADVGAELSMSEGAVKVAVHRLRKKFRALVHDEVAQTVASPDEVESEIRHLWSAAGR